MRFFPASAPEDVVVRDGSWGVLACMAAPHSGRILVEDERLIVAIAGRPLLFSMDHQRFSGPDAVGRQILDWLASNEPCDWFSRVSGLFALLIVDKRSGQMRLVTDSMGQLPVFQTRSAERCCFGTGLSGLAHLGHANPRLDLTSVAEFVLHGNVTFPHTLYDEVGKVPPGTEVQLDPQGRPVELEYWRPGEENPYSDLDEAARHLRESLVVSVAATCAGRQKLALFLSGGEDSRTVLAAVPAGRKVDCVTFADSYNREARLARRIARAAGHSWRFVQRPPDHYIRNFPHRCLLGGAETAIDQMHFLNFPQDMDLASYDAVMGGNSSDTFFKAYTVGKQSWRFRGCHLRAARPLPISERGVYQNVENYMARMGDQLPAEMAEAVAARKLAHVRRVQEFRPTSAAEWWNVWPTVHVAGADSTAMCRRLFNNYEPFAQNPLLRVAAAVPLSWKMNRRLFHRAFGGLQGRLGWIPHSDTWIPALGLKANIPASLFVGAIYATSGLLNKRAPNEGSWGIMSQVTALPEFLGQIETGRDSYAPVAPAFTRDFDDLLGDRGLESSQKMRLFQVLELQRNLA